MTYQYPIASHLHFPQQFVPGMTDGFNNIRAMRVAEIVEDFSSLQRQINQISATPSADDYNAQGYALLEECKRTARGVLAQPFAQTNPPPNGDPEQERQHLQYVMLDASARRLQAQIIYLRATAAMRWINSRNAVLNGQPPTVAHQPQLQQIDSVLQNELAGITNSVIYQRLLTADQPTKWVNEDPSLAAIEDWITRGLSS